MLIEVVEKFENEKPVSESLSFQSRFWLIVYSKVGKENDVYIRQGISAS